MLLNHHGIKKSNVSLKESSGSKFEEPNVGPWSSIELPRVQIDGGPKRSNDESDGDPKRLERRCWLGRWRPLMHGHGYSMQCPCIGHADTHRIRVGYVSDTPRGVSLTKQ